MSGHHLTNSDTSEKMGFVVKPLAVKTEMMFASSRAFRSAGFLEIPRSAVITTQPRLPISGIQVTSSVLGGNFVLQMRRIHSENRYDFCQLRRERVVEEIRHAAVRSCS